jgi:uncharacterized protein YoxC
MDNRELIERITVFAHNGATKLSQQNPATPPDELQVLRNTLSAVFKRVQGLEQRVQQLEQQAKKP